MPLHTENAETDALARKLAALKNVSLTEAVHMALANELAREHGKRSIGEIGV